MGRRPLSSIVLCGIVLALFASGAGAAALPQHAAHRHSAPGAARCKTASKPAGTARFSDWQFPDTLNPVQSKLLVTNEVDAALFEGLFVYNDRGQLQPDIARTIPTVANGGITNGGKTVTIRLKRGTHWSDGAEITAHDLQFSLAVGKDPASGPYCRDTCDVIQRIDAPNAYTAVLHLKRVYAPILAYGLPVLWPHQWRGAWNNNVHAAANKLWNDPSFNFEGPNFPTNGAYQVAPGGFKDRVHIVLRPMRYYQTLSCGPRLAHVIFAYYGSKYDMINAAVKHKTDITQDYTLADLSTLRKHTSAFHVYVQPAYSFEHLEFNVDRVYRGRSNPLANADVRAALALAFNRTELARSALGISPVQARAITAWTPLISTQGLNQPFADASIQGQWDPIAHAYLKNTGSARALADARALLARTPYKNGFTLDFLTVLGSPIRQAQEGFIAQAWSKLHVKVAAQFVSANTLFGDWSSNGPLAHGQFQVVMLGSTTSPDPDLLKFNLQGRFCDRASGTHTDLNGNYSCVRDAVIDRAFRNGARELAGAARAASYRAFQRQMNQQAYWVPLYYRPQLTTNDGRIAGFKPNPTQQTSEWNIAEWRLR